jgi:hypothetical protein
MAERITRTLALAALVLGMAFPASAQSRIRTMPGYAQWAEIAPKIATAVKSGAITPLWSADSLAFDYTIGDERWRFDVPTLTAMRLPEAPAEALANGPAAQPAAPSSGGVVLARGRGREADVLAPDGKSRAFSRGQNIWYAPGDGGPERQITFDGGVKERRVQRLAAGLVVVGRIEARLDAL